MSRNPSQKKLIQHAQSVQNVVTHTCKNCDYKATHITTIFHALGSWGFEWRDAIYKTGAMLIQELCLDT